MEAITLCLLDQIRDELKQERPIANVEEALVAPLLQRAQLLQMLLQLFNTEFFDIFWHFVPYVAAPMRELRGDEHALLTLSIPEKDAKSQPIETL